MPRMNRRADVLMGGGGMPGSINQRPYPFAAFGRGAFRDDSTILVALVAAGGAVHAWRPLEDPNGERLELIDARGFNAIAGGGGRFAALEVLPGRPVLFGSLGDLPEAGAADVAPDGTIAYKTRYHADLGITIVDPAGVVVERPDAFPVDVQALAGGRAVWRGGAHGRAPLRPTLPDAMNIRVAENVADADVIAYWSNAASALVVENDGAGVGYMFVTANGFDHDLISLNGEAILAASRTAGEGPEDLVKIAISSAGLRYLVPADGQAPAWFPAPTFGPIRITAPLPRPTFAFSHPVSVYPFKAAGSGQPDVFTLGTYSEHPIPPTPLPAGRFLLAHDAAGDWTIPAGALRSFDLVLWELYRVKGETLEQSTGRWFRQARQNLEQWPRDCGVIPMFYRQGGVEGGNPPPLWTIAEVLEGLEWLDMIVNLSPRIKVIAPFSYDRANGIVSDQALRQSFADLVDAAARAGAATLEEVPVDPVDPDPVDPPPATLFPPSKPFTEGTMSKVKFFEHIDYQGRSWEYDGDVPFVESANDQFSSVRIPAGVSVTLFEHRDYGGRSIGLLADVADMRTIGWNDAASSLKITDAGAAAGLRLKVAGAFVECNAEGRVDLVSRPSDAGTVAITRHDDSKRYDARFVKANRQLAISPDGALESRPAGSIGLWESFAATTQPDPDVAHLLYRVNEGVVIGGTVLQIVEE